MKIQTYLIHGFLSNFNSMSSFVIRNNNLRKINTVISFSWDSSQPSSWILFIIELLSRGLNFPEVIHSKWDRALKNIDESCYVLSSKINKETLCDCPILLVGHSMGVELIRRTIPLIRKDIRIYIIMMGGISTSFEYDDIFDRDNVIFSFNFYVKDDEFLNGYLDHMSGCFTDPIGIDHYECEKVYNVELDCRHCFHTKSKVVLDFFYRLVYKIKNGEI